MGKREKHGNEYQKLEHKKRLRITTVVIIVILLFLGFICTLYYARLQRTIREESKGYLEEVAERIGSNIERIIDDTYAMLFSFGSVMDEAETTTFDKFKALAEEQQEYWMYNEILLIDETGNAYDMEGDSIVLSGDIYLRTTLLQGQRAMSPLQIVDGRECSIFAVPLDGVNIDGIHMSAVAATYETATFGEILAMTAFDKRAYAHIVSNDGTLIIKSDSKAAANFGYNILSSIEGTKSLSGIEILELKKHLVEKEKGQIVFNYDGREEYMVYSPVGDTDWNLFTFVPTKVVNEKSDIILTITVLLCGFMIIAFGLLMWSFYYSTKNYQRKLERIAYVDDVTGGNTIERFYELAAMALKTNDKQYALIYTNFSKFKVLNEKFGRTVGDDILKTFHALIVLDIKREECIGRLSADNFCILLQCECVEQLRERFEKWYSSALRIMEKKDAVWSLPITELGIYLIENRAMPMTQMIDRAKLALQQASKKMNAKLVYAVYDDVARSRLFREKQLEDMMEDALKNGEFQVYFQPKYRVSNQVLAGGEALVRWVSQTEGMIYPDEFISLFEKNGFIVQLDHYVFCEVCRLIRKWIDEGRKPVKISVNCSRVQISDVNFLDKYIEAAKKYQIPPNMIEIELTENLVLEDVERFKCVIEEIHDAGFYCSMDDFGKGYSSLSMIQDISVDILKLDKVFFHNARRDPVRTESVVSSIVSMAKDLSMETVAEGVEHMDQVEMLSRIGCDLIQGYVFAKPMPYQEFEKLLD